MTEKESIIVPSSFVIYPDHPLYDQIKSLMGLALLLHRAGDFEEGQRIANCIDDLRRDAYIMHLAGKKGK